MKIKILIVCSAWVLGTVICRAATIKPLKTITIVVSPSSHERIKYGAQKLEQQLRSEGYAVTIRSAVNSHAENIIVGLLKDASIKHYYTTGHIHLAKTPGKEGFAINSSSGKIIIAGADNSGVMYGCLELADELRANHKLPSKIALVDQPEMVLRGTCIGMQKPELLPGRGTYEYPYTPENFPWFYNKALWLRYLDSMAQNRMNSLYLWSGHPFASLVKVKDYPYALEVDEATFQKNVDMYNFITREADKRGIWVLQGFYNIIVSKPFADYNHLKTQDRNRHIVPIIADYTRKSIAAFVQKYPNVGLMLTLGEAMEGVGQDDIDWFTKTIIPGVKDGLKALGRTDEPPIVLRSHDTDAPEDMKYAMPLYKNLYTMTKYNGEALTTYTPHGPWAQLHQTLSKLGRYGSADFIQKCVQAMHNIYHSNGLHIYPESSYWDWPYTADNTSPRLLEMDRDWIWYKEWARYSWNCHRDRDEEIRYWSQQLGAMYGCDVEHGKDILDAYEQSGEIAPKILRRFGITDGNRQTMTLGMLMSQLVDPEKYGLFSLLYNSEGPEGEMISEYAAKEWKHEPHIGETPVKVIDDIIKEGHNSVEAIDKAEKGVTANTAEFKRIKNDMYCYNAMANSYAHKVNAALLVLRYKYSNDIGDLEKALPELQISLDYYQKLVDLTKNTYLYANSMQTKQRKIPVGGNDGKNKTWIELLPYYQRELANFKKNIDSLKSPQATAKQAIKIQLLDAPVTLNTDTYKLSAGSQVYADSAGAIKNIAPELAGLKGIKMVKAKQVADGTILTFTNVKPVKVLVGYFASKTPQYLQEPQLETDASANDYGQADIKIANAIQIEGLPPVNVHTYTLKAGNNTLSLGKGACLILGFVDDTAVIPVYDAGLSNEGNIRDLRWLFK